MIQPWWSLATQSLLGWSESDQSIEEGNVILESILCVGVERVFCSETGAGGSGGKLCLYPKEQICLIRFQRKMKGEACKALNLNILG